MKYKFLTFIVLIVSVIFFYNVQDVNAGCTASGPVWTPNPVQWKTVATPETFDFTQNYTVGNDPIGDAATITDSCTAVATNGARCQVLGVSLVAYQDFDPCPQNRDAFFNSPINRIDTVAPTCGTWSGSGPTFTLSGSTDTGNTGGDSGISVAGGTCTATTGNSCNVTISDVAGNTRVCTSGIWAVPFYTVTASAVNGYVDGPSSQLIASGSTATFQFNTGTGNTPSFSTTCPTGPSGYDSVNGYWWYRTGAIAGNCSVTATFPVTPALSCAVDTATTPPPHYTGAGVKFLATGGSGTYSWTATGGTPSTGTGNQIWPSYSTAGTKTVSVSSAPQSASCTVNITAPATPVNGVCAATHFNCSSPATSTNNVGGTSGPWTWTCPGSNGGTNASCSEALTPPMSGTLNASNCTISAGSSSCNTNLSWTTTNPESTSRVTTPTNITVATTLSGSTTYSVSYGDRSFYLYNNGKLLAQTMATASCVSGAPWDTVSGTCKTSTAPVNGVCAATHNYCVAGTSVDTVDTPILFKWSCNGLNGGTSATCTEAKSPDLIASAPTPSTDVVINTPQRYTSTVTNQGTASTGASFSSFWQVATDWAGAGTVYDLLPTSSSSSLAASGTTPITYDMSFNGLGHKSMRACADKTSAASTGTIAESNETNNCSSWTNVTVTAAAAMTGTLTASNCTLVSGRCDTNLTWTTTNPEATSEVTTPTNIIVGTGLNNSATYTLTSAGDRIFYLYNNNKLLAQATATASESAPPSCTPTTSFSGSTTPASVSTGGEYFVACDFGVASGYIGASVGSGSCRFVDWSGKENTQANFNCTAGGIPGSFSNSCIISYNATYPYCTRTEAVNGLTVTSLPGGIINGLCSNPDNHLNPCSLGTPSTVVNGISSWTWSCNGSGVGHTDDTCVELKKKPKFEED